MKIAIDARMYGMENGGIGRYIVNLANELIRLDRKNEYTLLLRKKYHDSIDLPDGKLKKVLVDARHYTASEQVLLPRALNAEKPDLVHFPHFNVPVFYKGKYVVTIHDMLMHRRTGRAATTLAYPVYLVKRWGYKTVFANSIAKSAHIITPSKFVRDELSRHFPAQKNKITYIHEGVDVNVARDVRRSKLLEELKISRPYFLYAGNAYPHKNIPRAIEAIVGLNRSTERVVNLVIVTPRNVFQNRLMDLVKSHSAEEYVKIVGYVSDENLSNLYQQATAFLYPSREEGFGLPGLEAMANRTPVLASDIPVFREVYQDNAIYFNPLDFSSIQKAMNEILHFPKSKRAELVDRAFKYSKKFTWENTAKQTLKIYESV